MDVARFGLGVGDEAGARVVRVGEGDGAGTGTVRVTVILTTVEVLALAPLGSWAVTV